jgi:G3E family GTPase
MMKRENRMVKTEVYILAGFLGSGKTTLLKRLLSDERGLNRKTAVIMNELGQVSIDSGAVEEDVTLKELLGGCICCSMQDKLESQLQELLFNEQPDVIYIEATGAAHPVEILDACLSPLFADRMIIKGIITTVDPLRWINREKLNPSLQQLILEQVRYADLILVNRMDELSGEKQARLTYEIQAINPKSPCLLTSHSKVPLDIIRNLSVSLEISKSSTQKIKLKLSSFVFQFTSSINQVKFEQFLISLPDTIYRIKGYVKFDQDQYPVLFQFSYGMPIYLKEYMDLPLNLVFIGENINWDEISKMLVSLENSI